MLIFADTHLHLYPQQDAERFLGCLVANLERLAAVREDGGRKALLMGVLAERHDCHCFRDWSGGVGLPAGGLRPRPEADGRALALLRDGRPAAYLLPGRQVVTAERIELLALTVDAEIPDGLVVEEALRRVRAAGALPVLSWAPGKWFFARGRVVRRLIDAACGGSLAVGDTTLRPTLWPRPRLMAAAQRRGLAVLAGSDPLPLPGEERWAGTYAAAIEAPDRANPVEAFKSALSETAPAVTLLGRRHGSLRVLHRLWRNARLR